MTHKYRANILIINELSLQTIKKIFFLNLANFDNDEQQPRNNDVCHAQLLKYINCMTQKIYRVLSCQKLIKFNNQMKVFNTSARVHLRSNFNYVKNNK